MLKDELQSVNLKRKQHQLKIGAQIHEVENAWKATVKKNIEIVNATDRLRNDV
jgi:hypothetical protein